MGLLLQPLRGILCLCGQSPGSGFMGTVHGNLIVLISLLLVFAGKAPGAAVWGCRLRLHSTQTLYLPGGLATRLAVLFPVSLPGHGPLPAQPASAFLCPQQGLIPRGSPAPGLPGQYPSRLFVILFCLQRKRELGKVGLGARRLSQNVGNSQR